MWDGINTDAETIAKLIRPGDKVAYFNDGRYAWNSQQIAMFPHNEHVTITVLGGPADVGDCETGDMTPAAAANWIRKQKAAGYLRPTVYRSLAFMKDLREATGDLVMGKDWDSWVADYDNSTTENYAGEAAKQYQSTSDYDKSVIYDAGWPHRTKGPTVASILNPKWPAGRTLSLHNIGNAVEALQTSLSGSGMVGVRGIGVNGIFGQQTLTALRNFQESQSLTVDGIAGPNTRNALIRLGLLNSAGQAA
jgi:peptidoglycan hydrolase-like protein with peptidoglycan-binding domain